jgi:hypothetical protein
MLTLTAKSEERFASRLLSPANKVKAEAAAVSEAVPFFMDFFDFLEDFFVSSCSTLRFDRFSILSDAAIVFVLDVQRAGVDHGIF